MAPRRLVELYRLAVVLGASGLFIAGLSRVGGRQIDWWVVLSLLVAGILAGQFPLRVSLQESEGCA